jgi:hypothetical protein
MKSALKNNVLLIPACWRNTGLGLAFAFAVSVAVHAADFDIRNEVEFRRIVPAGSALHKLAGDMQFLEGPVWVTSRRTS